MCEFKSWIKPKDNFHERLELQGWKSQSMVKCFCCGDWAVWKSNHQFPGCLIELDCCGSVNRFSGTIDSKGNPHCNW
jgi:hypothetical protein